MKKLIDPNKIRDLFKANAEVNYWLSYLVTTYNDTPEEVEGGINTIEDLIEVGSDLIHEEFEDERTADYLTAYIETVFKSVME